MWNYRIIKKKDNKTTTYEVHEVYYDESGNIEGWTEEAVNPFGESLNELKADLNHFLHAFKSPVLEFFVKDGKEMLIEEESPSELNKGHFFELMDRAYMMTEYFDLSVASHPVARKDKELSELVSVIEDKLAELYQITADRAFNDDFED